MAPRATMGRALSRKHHTAAITSPSSYFRQKVLKAGRAGLVYLRRAAVALGAAIVRLLGLVRYMNVLPGLLRFLRPVRHPRKRTYEATDSVTYVSGLRDRVVHFLSTESANRGRVLRWMRGVAPSLPAVDDLTGQWSDGLALCVLINEVAPGACPRSDLLQTATAQQRVNNCRLALRLVQRNLGIREPMTPDEMANPSRSSGSKLLAYLISIRNASLIPVQEAEAPVRPAETGAPNDAGLERECSASGSGLVVAVVGKRARFTITTQDYKYKNLYVSLAGPGGEKVRRKIAASKAGRRAMIQAGGGGSGSMSSRDEPPSQPPQPPPPPPPGPADSAEPIPLDYQVVKPGSYQVSYIPRSLGIYQVAITWGGEHIKNSPFRVRSTTAKNIERTSVRAAADGAAPLGKGVSFRDERAGAAGGERAGERGEGDPDGGGGPAASDDEGPVTRARRQSLVRQPHVLALRDSYESISTSPYSSLCSSMVSSVDQSNDTSSDVFLPRASSAGPGHHLQHPHHPFLSRHNSSASTASSRSGSIMSRSSSIMQSTERSAGVKTRRKVIRRIIRGAGGTEEEVTYPSAGRRPSALSSSQMSSVTSSRSISTSVSVDDRSPKFSTSSASSAVSAPSAYRPRPARPADPRERYAAQMSAVVLGRAYREVAGRLAEVGPPGSADGPGETRKGENQNLKANADDGTRPGSRFVPSEIGPPSPIDGDNTPRQRSTQPATGTIRQSPVQATAASRMDTSGSKETSAAQTAEESVQRGGEQSADLEEYLEHKEKFLRSLAGGSECGESSRKTAAVDNTGDDPGGAPGRSVRPTAGHTSRGADATRHATRRLHKKRKEDRATQCTAQDIKTATGWVSRRSGHRGAKPSGARPAHADSRGPTGRGDHEDTDDDGGGAAPHGRPSRSKGSPAEPSGRAAPSRGWGGGGGGSRRLDSDQRRRRPGAAAGAARGQVRQSTFDSGFSDENAQASHEARRPVDEARAHPPSAPSRDGGRRSHGQTSSSPNPSSDCDRQGAASTSLLGNARDELPQTGEACAPSQYVPIEIVPPTPTTKHTEDLLTTEPSGREAPKVSLDETTDRCLAQVQRLKVVEACRPNDSTTPTPGDSSEGNISSSDAELPAATSAEDRSHASSGSSASDSPGDRLRTPAGPCRDGVADGTPANQARAQASVGPGDESRGVDELSLDALLRTLENDPEYSTREFLRKYQPAVTASAGVASEEEEGEGGDPRMPAGVPAERPGGTGLKTRSLERAETPTSYNDALSNDGSLTSPSQPLPERCRASGVGIYHGIVGEKNNFQVRTMSAGDGSLSVTVRGPRPHTVNETNMLYTGDDLYEVIYDVSLAGFYVISVKWADRHIPDSPFIVKVVF